MLKELFFKKNRQKISFKDIDYSSVPKHVAIIMDGNGRWAKSKGLPRIAGHREGIRSVIEIARTANKLGISFLTLFAFSTENWKRPVNEINYLMKLPSEFLLDYIEELIENNVQIRIIGFDNQIPDKTLEALREAEEKTKNNTGLVLNFALNYGSRAEIINATKHIVQDVVANKISEIDIDEELFNSYLLTKDYPEPELLIRTSGELRISNFLLWQLAYSELWFTPVYWPNFNEQFFIEAIYEYQQRIRRFGGI
ncbi:MAG: isoprenyl transferase [Vulcanibacillus sp.]